MSEPCKKYPKISSQIMIPVYISGIPRNLLRLLNPQCTMVQLPKSRQDLNHVARIEAGFSSVGLVHLLKICDRNWIAWILKVGLYPSKSS
jgi:hypothetical protein